MGKKIKDARKENKIDTLSNEKDRMELAKNFAEQRAAIRSVNNFLAAPLTVFLTIFVRAILLSNQKFNEFYTAYLFDDASARITMHLNAELADERSELEVIVKEQLREDIDAARNGEFADEEAEQLFTEAEYDRYIGPFEIDFRPALELEFDLSHLPENMPMADLLRELEKNPPPLSEISKYAISIMKESGITTTEGFGADAWVQRHISRKLESFKQKWLIKTLYRPCNLAPVRSPSKSDFEGLSPSQTYILLRDCIKKNVDYFYTNTGQQLQSIVDRKFTEKVSNFGWYLEKANFFPEFFMAISFHLFVARPAINFFLPNSILWQPGIRQNQIPKNFSVLTRSQIRTLQKRVKEDTIRLRQGARTIRQVALYIAGILFLGCLFWDTPLAWVAFLSVLGTALSHPIQDVYDIWVKNRQIKLQKAIAIQLKKLSDMPGVQLVEYQSSEARLTSSFRIDVSKSVKEVEGRRIKLSSFRRTQMLKGILIEHRVNIEGVYSECLDLGVQQKESLGAATTINNIIEKFEQAQREYFNQKNSDFKTRDTEKSGVAESQPMDPSEEWRVDTAGAQTGAAVRKIRRSREKATMPVQRSTPQTKQNVVIKWPSLTYDTHNPNPMVQLIRNAVKSNQFVFFNIHAKECVDDIFDFLKRIIVVNSKIVRKRGEQGLKTGKGFYAKNSRGIWVKSSLKAKVMSARYGKIRALAFSENVNGNEVHIFTAENIVCKHR